MSRKGQGGDIIANGKLNSSRAAKVVTSSTSVSSKRRFFKFLFHVCNAVVLTSLSSRDKVEYLRNVRNNVVAIRVRCAEAKLVSEKSQVQLVVN